MNFHNASAPKAQHSRAQKAPQGPGSNASTQPPRAKGSRRPAAGQKTQRAKLSPEQKEIELRKLTQEFHTVKSRCGKKVFGTHGRARFRFESSRAAAEYCLRTLGSLPDGKTIALSGGCGDWARGNIRYIKIPTPWWPGLSYGGRTGVSKDRSQRAPADWEAKYGVDLEAPHCASRGSFT